MAASLGIDLGDENALRRHLTRDPGDQFGERTAMIGVCVRCSLATLAAVAQLFVAGVGPGAAGEDLAGIRAGTRLCSGGAR
jgi:hypothetical protein